MTAEEQRLEEAWTRKVQWHNFILFSEYSNGDNGAELGANHQTGWTGLVATLISS